MGDLNTLKQGILNEAEQEAQRLLEEARMQADSIIQEARITAESRRKDLLAAGEKEAAERQRRIEIASELDAKRLLLQAKDQILNDAVNQAMEKLRSLPGDRKNAWYFKLMIAACETGNETVHPAAVDRTLIGQILPLMNQELRKQGKPGQVTLGADQPGIDGGFIVSGGRYRVDNSIHALLSAARDELVPEVARILFA